MNTLSEDRMLVQEFLRGRDGRPLTDLVLRYQRPIFAFLLRLLRDPHQAEEAAQETFLRMLRGLSGYRVDQPFRPWLYQIALNTARSLRARRARQGEREGAAASHRPPGESSLDPSEGAFRRELETLVRELPLAQKEAVVLHYYQGLSHSEVASVQGVPPGTVATRIHAGLETLRSRLAPLGLTLSALALAEHLGATPAEAAPSSILATVLDQASGLRGPDAAVQGGLLMAKVKIATLVPVVLLAMSVGVGAGYAIRASRDVREEPRTAVLAASRSSGLAARGELPLSGRDDRVPAAPPATGAGRLAAVPDPAPAAPDPRSKTRKFAAFLARVMKSAAASPNRHAQLSPQETSDFVAFLSDPGLAEMMKKTDGASWAQSPEFMFGILDELGIRLTEDQKAQLGAALGQATKRLEEPSASSVQEKLQELDQTRTFFEGLGKLLTPDQNKSLEPYLTLFRPSVPALVVRAAGADEQVPALLDCWSKNLVPLNDLDRLQVSSTAADAVARLRSIQSDLELRYGPEFMALLPSVSSAGFSASSLGMRPPAAPAEGLPDLDTSDMTAKLYDAFGRLLLLEKEVRQSLASVLPDRADTIRNADPYVIVFGPKK